MLNQNMKFNIIFTVGDVNNGEFEDYMEEEDEEEEEEEDEEDEEG